MYTRPAQFQRPEQTFFSAAMKRRANESITISPLTSRYGLSAISCRVSNMYRACFSNPAPGTHAGTCLTAA
jgi:hypothetical protein